MKQQDWVKFNINYVVDVFLHRDLRANSPNIENVLIFRASLFWSDGLLSVSSQTILGIGGVHLEEVQIPTDHLSGKGNLLESEMWIQKAGLIDTEKASDILQHPFKGKKNKQTKKRNFLHLLKKNLQKKKQTLQQTAYLWVKTECFPSKIRDK